MLNPLMELRTEVKSVDKDEKLVEQTGGILQGMSGSPIVQNGKFVGALTHVFLNRPELGYAVFGYKMVNLAKQ